jgi:hypothetical protein
MEIEGSCTYSISAQIRFLIESIRLTIQVLTGEPHKRAALGEIEHASLERIERIECLATPTFSEPGLDTSMTSIKYSPFEL